MQKKIKLLNTGKNDDSDNENDVYDNNASQSNSSDVKSFHEKWIGIMFLNIMKNYKTEEKQNNS